MMPPRQYASIDDIMEHFARELFSNAQITDIDPKILRSTGVKDILVGYGKAVGGGDASETEADEDIQGSHFTVYARCLGLISQVYLNRKLGLPLLDYQQDNIGADIDDLKSHFSNLLGAFEVLKKINIPAREISFDDDDVKKAIDTVVDNIIKLEQDKSKGPKK